MSVSSGFGFFGLEVFRGIDDWVLLIFGGSQEFPTGPTDGRGWGKRVQKVVTRLLVLYGGVVWGRKINTFCKEIVIRTHFSIPPLGNSNDFIWLGQGADGSHLTGLCFVNSWSKSCAISPEDVNSEPQTFNPSL